jgi:hypothetical protein
VNYLAFLTFLVALLAPAAARAACTYPKGSVGTSLNEVGFITAVVPEANGHQLRVTYTYDDPIANGPPYSDIIEFGDGAGGAGDAEIVGAGWSGSKLGSCSTVGGSACGLSTAYACVRLNGSPAFAMLSSTSNLICSWSLTAGVGITKIRGMGPSGEKKLRFYYFDSHVSHYMTASVLGTSYTNCTASVAGDRDWRWAFVEPRHPDALTIEALLFG